MWPERHAVYTTADGVVVFVSQGVKSQHDFKVQYQEPGKRVRTPKHIHLIIDLYMKRAGNRALTARLVEHIIDEITLKIHRSASSPPVLQIFSPDHAAQFQALDAYGEYPVEFLLVAVELIMIQEKTNYPEGVMNLNLFRRFRDEADIFSVVSAATFQGR